MANRRYATKTVAGGAILLEVVLALTLFVSGAAVIGGSLSRSLDAAYRLRYRTQAADLAVTLVSEVQMGLLEAVDAGPTEYEDEDLLDWTWSMTVEDIENVEDMVCVTVTVTHGPTGAYHALSQWVQLPAESEL